MARAYGLTIHLDKENCLSRINYRGRVIRKAAVADDFRENYELLYLKPQDKHVEMFRVGKDTFFRLSLLVPNCNGTICDYSNELILSSKHPGSASLFIISDVMPDCFRVMGNNLYCINVSEIDPDTSSSTYTCRIEKLTFHNNRMKAETQPGEITIRRPFNEVMDDIEGKVLSNTLSSIWW